MSCPSAPPGSTRPESRSPEKRPPVMLMMRRRPSGESPSSCGAASVISALSRGRSFKLFQDPEEFAEGARRLALFLLFPDVADQGAQRLQVGAGMLGGERRKRGVVLDQAAAPGLEAAVARGGLRRAALDFRH